MNGKSQESSNASRTVILSSIVFVESTHLGLITLRHSKHNLFKVPIGYGAVTNSVLHYLSMGQPIVLPLPNIVPISDGY